MSTYYADGDLAAYSARLANHEAERDAAQASYDAALIAWQAEHDAWVADPGDPPAPEPVAPTAPLEQAPPEPPAVTYTAREAAEPEQIETATGPALVLPPRLVVTGSDGATFALNQADLDAGYTPTSDPLPPARAAP